MIQALKVTAKGQVTLRKALLKHLGVKPGDQVFIETLPSGRVELRSQTPQGSISAFLGCLHKDGGRKASLEDIAAAIEQGWTGEP